MVAHQSNRIATEIGLLVGLQHDAAVERSGTLGSGILKVIRLCNVGMEAELPAVWVELAKALRKMHCTIIQHHIDEMADKIWDVISLGVTPALSEKGAAL